MVSTTNHNKTNVQSNNLPRVETLLNECVSVMLTTDAVLFLFVGNILGRERDWWIVGGQ